MRIKTDLIKIREELEKDCNIHGYDCSTCKHCFTDCDKIHNMTCKNNITGEINMLKSKTYTIDELIKMSLNNEIKYGTRFYGDLGVIIVECNGVFFYDNKFKTKESEFPDNYLILCDCEMNSTYREIIENE